VARLIESAKEKLICVVMGGLSAWSERFQCEPGGNGFSISSCFTMFVVLALCPWCGLLKLVCVGDS
jgi:hypothetical protein